MLMTKKFVSRLVNPVPLRAGEEERAVYLASVRQQLPEGWKVPHFFS